MDFKSKIYKSYRSAFKGKSDLNSIKFGALKLRPVIEKWVRSTSRESIIIDLGCGAGELLYAFQLMGFQELGGCDISLEQVTVTREFFPKVECCNLFDYLRNVSNDTVDIITVFDVLEHLGPEPTFEVLGEIFRTLKPGGRLIAHVPNGCSPFVGQVFWGDMTHEWCFTPESAKTLCLLHDFIEFDSSEHLGCSDSVAGNIRKLLWIFVRFGINMVNLIETGLKQKVLTRNFAFTAIKPLND